MYKPPYYNSYPPPIRRQTIDEVINITTRTITGPIIVPDTPDCDYKNGEELLSNQKIEHLRQTFKDYQIIDYQHQFTNNKEDYFMKKVGTPLRLFYNDEEVTFEDVTGQMVTVPPQTLWLESEITDPVVVKQIDDKEIVAYSITVSEKSDADTVMRVYNQLASKHASKGLINHKKMQEIHHSISTKRTLIRDIEDPALLTVSVVKFPCVNKAKFCKKSLLNNYGDNMTEKSNDNANQTFIDSVKDAVKEFRNSLTEETETEQNQPVETVEAVKEEPVTREQVNTMITEQVTSAVDELKSTLKAHFGDPGDRTRTPWIQSDLTPEGEEIPEEEDGEGDVNDETSQKEDEVEVVTEPETIGEEEEDGEATTTDDGEGEEPAETTTTADDADDAEEDGEVDDVEEATKEDTTTHAPTPTPSASAQKSRTHATIKGGHKKMSNSRDELSVIQDAIKNKLSTKSVQAEEINYDGLGLVPYANKFLDQIEDPIFYEAYKNSLSYKADFTIDETNTRKAILNTAMFTTYVQKIIQSEPLLEDANYITGVHGKAHIYGIEDTIATEDGALPEHFYFDKDVALQEATINDIEVETYPQRTKINISDRQRLANVFGDDLVNILLDRTVQRLKQGVAAARFYGNESAANTVDLQYRRQDGYLKGAGVQLTSDDVNLDKITDIFDTMFYSLPEEAQVESDYVFYVPTNVRRAFGSYFLDKAADRAIDFIGQRTPLYWGDIPIKVSPTLNNKPVRDLLDDGNVSVLLTKPTNTHFVVGREAGIEPKRYAETSSDTFYATIDTANAYSISDYAVRLSLTADEYAGLVGGASGSDDQQGDDGQP